MSLSRSYAWSALLLLTPAEMVVAAPPDRDTLQRELLRADTEKRLEAAIMLLNEFDPEHKDALSVLRAGLCRNTPRRSDDVVALARHNPAVVKLLLETCADREVETDVRIRVLCELKPLGLVAKEGIPQLIGCLDESPEIGQYAAEVLGSMKGEAKAAIPTLEKQVKQDRTPRWQIDRRVATRARMLLQIDPSNKVAISYLTRQLKGWSYEQRSAGVSGLRDCPMLPPEALQELQRIAQKDDYEFLRAEARTILEKHKAPK